MCTEQHVLVEVCAIGRPAKRTSAQVLLMPETVRPRR